MVTAAVPVRPCHSAAAGWFWFMEIEKVREGVEACGISCRLGDAWLDLPGLQVPVGHARRAGTGGKAWREYHPVAASRPHHPVRLTAAIWPGRSGALSHESGIGLESRAVPASRVWRLWRWQKAGGDCFTADAPVHHALHGCAAGEAPGHLYSATRGLGREASPMLCHALLPAAVSWQAFV